MKLPESLKLISNIFAAQGVELYLVGGFVRNIVLGIPGGDFDICSSVHPDIAAQIARDAGLTVIEKALSLGTIEIRMKMGGEWHAFEHTTWRKDYYPPGGEHRPYRVAFTTDIRQDAQRRDFSMNALYMHIATEEIIDPTGRGLNSIKEKRLEAAADEADITIQDDGLRIMRMARFASELGFGVSDELLSSAARHAAVLGDISAERKFSELKKIIMADTKYPSLPQTGPIIGLKLLRQTGAIKYILPRLWKGSGVKQSPQYHAYDVLDHGLYTCSAAPAIWELRLAGLLHDIGKPEALRQGGNMYGHEIIGERLAREELSALKSDNNTKNKVLPLIRQHMFDLEGKAKPKIIRRRAVMMGKEGFEMLIALRRADVAGSGKRVDKILSADHWQTELTRMIDQHVPWRVKDLCITGDDIARNLHIKPSPVIGQILEALYKECVVSPGMNNTETLIRRSRLLAQSILK